MRDLYSDDYESVAVGDADRLIPEGVKKLAGAAMFLGLVAALGLWSYRLGTRDAAEVPIIRAMEGPARVEPEDPGGLKAAHQGLEVNSVLAGRPAPMPRDAAPAEPTPAALAEEDAPQGELVLSAPAMMAERVLGEGEDLPMPPQEEVTTTADGIELAAPDADAELAAVDPGPRPRNRPANLRAAPAKTTPVASVAASAPADATPAAAPPKPAPTEVAAAAPAAQEASGVRPGARLVQLGAVDSEEITRKAWDQLVARNGDLLGSKSLFVERATSNARVFYRLRVAGFDNADQTRQVCEALRARGVACIPVTLQ
jgi:hypothetical protein